MENIVPSGNYIVKAAHFSEKYRAVEKYDVEGIQQRGYLKLELFREKRRYVYDKAFSKSKAEKEAKAEK